MELLELIIGLSILAIFYVLGCGLPWSQENRERRAKMRKIDAFYHNRGI